MDDHRQGEALGPVETLEQGLGPPPNGLPLGGGAEIAAMALEFHRTCRCALTLLGVMATTTVVFVHAPYLPPYL